MLEELRLRNVGVIEDAALVLGPGLSVLTGETGAGKTMVLTGLGLLMGRRPDPRLVRHGSAQGEVEGVLTARDETGLRAWAEPAGGVLDDGALLVSRVVPASGRARAYLGGRSVPAATLAELADTLITVHGQADQQRLRSPAHQRAALDGFAGLDDHVQRYRSAFDRVGRLEAELRDWEDAARRVAVERDRLREGLAAIEEVDPQPGEDDDLRQRSERLTNIEELRTAVEGAYAVLTGDELQAGVVDRLVAEAGRVDVLANVAGIMDFFLPLADLDDATWQHVMAVNVDGPMRLSRAVLPGMLERGGGAIVTVASKASVGAGACASVPARE